MSHSKAKDFEKVLNSGAEVDDIFKDDSSIQQNTYEIEKLTSSDIDTNLYVFQKKITCLEKLFTLVNSKTSYGILMADILKICMEQIRSEAASLFEVDYQANEYFFRAVAGKSSQDLLKVRVPKGSGIVGRVCESQKAEIMSKMKDAAVHLNSIGKLIGFEARDVIACPIIIRGKTFGCIELLNPIGSDSYSLEDIKILQFICTHAANVIENRLVLAKLSKDNSNINYDKKAA